MRESLWIVVALIPALASASHLGPLEVAQPIGHENGVALSRVTFLVHGDGLPPGYAILYICKPYEVPVEGQGSQNCNAAAIAGIQARPEYSEERGGDGLFGGDTLRVILDLREAQEVNHPVWSLRGTSTLVKQSILEVAARDRRHYPHLRFVDLRILGPEEFGELGGVTDLGGAIPNAHN